MISVGVMWKIRTPPRRRCMRGIRVIDFDAAKRFPNSPGKLNPQFNVGDHLHPNYAGHRAMADAINLKLFE